MEWGGIVKMREFSIAQNSYAERPAMHHAPVAEVFRAGSPPMR